MAAIVALGVSGGSGVAAPNAVPVLLELFTSEGCSDCPPADRLLETLDQSQPFPGGELIVLSEHVDYFNSPGWSDPWSSPANTARQRDYERYFKLRSSYTPQLVVDGQTEMVGSNGAAARDAIRRAMQSRKLPVSLEVTQRAKDHLTVHVAIPSAEDSAAGALTVYVAVADNQDQSRVGGGENGGKTLRHVAVVRALGAVGSMTKGEAFEKDVSLPIRAGMGTNGLRVVAFLQDQSSGRIAGATQRRVSAL